MLPRPLLTLALVVQWTWHSSSSFSLLPSPSLSASKHQSFYSRHSMTKDKDSINNNIDNDNDDEDYIDTDSLGDWRNFRKSLTLTAEKPRPVSKENEELLESQNQQLFQEYRTGAWAHEISTVRHKYTHPTHAPIGIHDYHFCQTRFY